VLRSSAWQGLGASVTRLVWDARLLTSRGVFHTYQMNGRKRFVLRK